MSASVFFLAFLAVGLAPRPAAADGFPQPAASGAKGVVRAVDVPVASEYRPSFSFRFGGVPSAGVRGAGIVGGASAELSYLGRFDAFAPLSGPWYLRGGLTWQGFTFEHDPGVPLPDDLHGVSVDFGIGRRFGDAWSVQCMVNPGVYSDFAGADPSDFSFSGTLGVRWKPSDDLEALVGVRYSQHSDLALLPAAGVRWRIDRAWELDLRVPRPRVVWHAGDAFELYAGADVRLGTYRVGRDLADASGEPRVGAAWLDYREVRAACGVGWGIGSGVDLEFEVGWAVHRRFTYDQVDLAYRLRPAPYGELALRVRF